MSSSSGASQRFGLFGLVEKVPRNEEKKQKIHKAGPNIREFLGTRAKLAREGTEEMERGEVGGGRGAEQTV